MNSYLICKLGSLCRGGTLSEALFLKQTELECRPGAAKAGFHKGEAFYKREDISELHTKDKWIQQGLEVMESELKNPFKVVAKRGSKKSQAASKDAGDEEDVSTITHSAAC